MPSRPITIVSYGKEQKMQDIDEEQQPYILLIDCTVFTDSCITLLKKKFQNESLKELEQHIESVHTIADLYHNVQRWISGRPDDQHSLTIYCLSDEGIFRSVALANILCDFLSSQGYDVTVLHSRLALLGINM